MTERNSTITKAKLLAVATQEFAAYGFAGARVDRIAQLAGCGKQLIYSYFGNKQGLFEAVMKTHISSYLNTVPLNGNDLVNYAAGLYEYLNDHSEFIRLMQWYTLEGKPSAAIIEYINSSNLGKVTAIAHSQQEGNVSNELPANEILTAIVALSTTWAIGIQDSVKPNSEADVQLHKKTIEHIVKRFIA
jgi:AcrR family transcriptional regulator